MTTLTLVLLSQLLAAYVWYPLAYRVTAAFDLPQASPGSYEYHRGYAYLLGVAVAYIIPPAPGPAYWGTLLVAISLAAGTLTALLVRVRREDAMVRPLTTAEIASMARTDASRGQTGPVSRGGRGRGSIKSSPTRRRASR